MVLRSDESANESEIERDQNFRGKVGKGVGAAAGLATAAIGGPLAARIMPFLSEYIPSALAIKGINKVSPKLGAFLQKGQEMGLDAESGLNFIKEKLAPPKEERNIIQQYSPELHSFIDQEIKKGTSPIDAAILANKDKKFREILSKLSKEHKTPWSTLVENIYGGAGQVPQQSSLQQQPSQQPQQMQQSGNPQAKQQLMQAMQALSQKLRT